MSLKVNRKFDKIEFDEVKEKLKEFLKEQDEFKDFNFEGSNINALLDVLAYSIHYLLYYLNVSINEFFLQYTSIKENAITLAKSLGYQARRKISSTGEIKMIPISEDKTIDSSNTLLVPAYTEFSSGDYTLISMEDKTMTSSSGVIIPLKEGELNTITYSVEAGNSSYTINENADDIENNFFRVFVNGEEYTANSDYKEFIDGSSKIYFLSRIQDKLRVTFGDGIFGINVPDGSNIQIIYLKSSGPVGMDFVNFDNSLIDDNGEIWAGDEFSITINTQILGGANEESLDSIKLNAPKSFSAQERAVTKDDYDVILSQSAYNANVWGGDKEYEMYSLPNTYSLTSDFGLEAGDIDLFLGGVNPPYYTTELLDTLDVGDFVSEVYDDMVWEVKLLADPISNMPAPLEDTTYTYWKLTHKPKIGHVFMTGFNVDGDNNKIKYSEEDIINFKEYLKDTKIITLKTIPKEPMIIDYNLNIQISKIDNFLGNGQELINDVKDSVLEYFNNNFSGWDKEVIKSQMIDLVMNNSNIKYCTIDYTNSNKLYEPYGSGEYITLRYYNGLEAGTIEIKDSLGEVVCYDNGSGQMMNGSDVLINNSRVDYDSGTIQFEKAETTIDFDSDEYTVEFEYSDEELQENQKEVYVNEIKINDIAVGFRS